MHPSVACCIVALLATLCVGQNTATVDPGSMLVRSNETDVEKIRRNQSPMLLKFRNDTHEFIFTSSGAINAFAAHFAFGPGDGMTPAVSAYRRLQLLEPADKSIVFYVFFFRKDVVGTVTTAYVGGDSFFAQVGILHMEPYVQAPADRSPMARSRVVTMYRMAGKDAPLQLNAFNWPLGLVITLPFFVTFEALATKYLKRGNRVVKGGKDTSLLGRWRRARAKRRAAAKPSTEPLPDDSIPEVRVDAGHITPRKAGHGSATAAGGYDPLGRLAMDMSPVDLSTSTPPFGFAEPRYDASVEPLTVEGLPAPRSAAVSPAISPRAAMLASDGSPRPFTTSQAALLQTPEAGSPHEL